MRYALILLAGMVLAVGADPTAGDAKAERPYEVAFSGTFRLDFGTGEGLTDELTFQGAGDGKPLGPSNIDGYSRTRSGPDGCSTIVHDEVTIQSERKTVLDLVNSGVDCVDPVSSPGRILIHGSGSTQVQSGGEGTWTVDAEVTRFGPGFAEGTFGPLRFSGTLDWPTATGHADA